MGSSGEGWCGAAMVQGPGETREERSTRIGDQVERIPHPAPGKMWEDDFEKHRPKSQSAADLTDCRREVVGPEPRDPLEPEQHWQRARDEQHVAEMIREKRRAAAAPTRREAEAIQCVKQSAHEKDRVQAVTERAHLQSAKSAMPAATAAASVSLRMMIMGSEPLYPFAVAVTRHRGLPFGVVR